MEILSQVATTMQIVLTETANQLAKETSLIKRQRKLTGASFAQTLVFGWLSNPDATLEDLAQTSAAVGAGVSAEALFQRFTPDAAVFLGQLVDHSVAAMIRAFPVAIDVLNRFEGVYLLDSSIVALPDELADIWQGCGGQEKNTAASVKLSVCWEMTCGDFQLHLESGREQDKSSPLAKQSLPKGALRIADLGYFSLERLAQMGTDGSYWLTRVKLQCAVYADDGESEAPDQLLEFLQSQRGNPIDVPVRLGAKAKLPCRLIAVRVPKPIADARRRQLRARLKRKGKTPSKRQLKLADWTILATNVPAEWLTVEEARVLMRFRWQIERLFRLFKEHGKIDEWRSEKPWRILCEMSAKLIAMIVQHWLLLTGSWAYPDRSLFKAAKTIQRHAMHVACALASGQLHRLMEACEIIQTCLAAGARINKRSKEPHAYQLLLALDQNP